MWDFAPGHTGKGGGRLFWFKHFKQKVESTVKWAPGVLPARFNCDGYATLVMCSIAVYSLQKHANVADLLTPHPTKMTHSP